MIYQKNKRNIKKSSIIIILFVIIIASLIIFPIQRRKIYYSVYRVIDTVFSKTKNAEIALKNIPSSKSELIKENKRLYFNLLEAQLLVNNLREQGDLKIGVFKNSSSQIEAEVVSNGELPFSSEFIIDKGSSHGVAVGDDVFSGSNTYIGSIVNVFKKQSVVSLATKHGKMTEGVISETGLSVVLEGMGGQSFMFKLPKEEAIKENGIVLLAKNKTSSLAVVREIVVNEKYPYKVIYVNSPLNMNYISKVYVQKSYE